MNTPKLITLSCPSCGAKLEITPNLDRFACSYCGQEHIVNRTGGTISLSPVVEAIHQVKTGVDKTASELAIVRIQKEISDLQVERQNILRQSPPPTIKYFSYPYIFVGVILLFLSVLAFLLKNYDMVFFCLAGGVFMFLYGVLPILRLPQNRRFWKQSTEPRLNILDGQIAEKKAELERNQNLVRN